MGALRSLRIAHLSQLRDVDEQGFMAAGALLWCRQVEGVAGMAVLLAEEKRTADGPIPPVSASGLV